MAKKVIFGNIHVTPEEAIPECYVRVVRSAPTIGVEPIGYMELTDGTDLDVWRDANGRLVGSPIAG